MTPEQAREILLLYRPGSRDAEDPEVIEAMALARQDATLGTWFAEHCIFQEAMRSSLRQIEVPQHLRAALRAPKAAAAKPGRWSARVRWQLPAWLRSPAWLVPAGAAAVLALAATVWFYKPVAANRLANFQSRIIGSALRDYSMDIETPDMGKLREYLASKGGPADYEVNRGLQRLSLTGGGLLRWRDYPVSMVCFDRGDKQMLFLFVVDRSALKDPPPETPQVTKMNDRVACSWSRGQKTYVLSGPEEPRFVEKYL